MDVPTVVTSAVIAGAVGAVTAIVAVRIKEEQLAETHRSELENAYSNGCSRGWNDANVAANARWDNVQPQDFAQVP